jgi:hypothetical protein
VLPFRSTQISSGLNSPQVSMLGLCIVRRLIEERSAAGGSGLLLCMRLLSGAVILFGAMIE